MLLFCCGERLFAQQDSSKAKTKAFIELRGGVGISLLYNPVDQSRTDYTNEFERYGKPGYVIDILAEIPFKNPNFGIAAQGGFSINSFDADALIFVIPNYLDGAHNFEQDGNYYKGLNFLAGIFLNVPVHKISFDFRIMPGILLFSNPGIMYSYQNVSNTGYNSDTTTEKALTGAAFACDLRASLRFNAYKGFSFSFNVDLFGSFKSNAFITTYQNTEIISYGHTYSANASKGVEYANLDAFLINFTLGIAYRIP